MCKQTGLAPTRRPGPTAVSLSTFFLGDLKTVGLGLTGRAVAVYVPD